MKITKAEEIRQDRIKLQRDMLALIAQFMDNHDLSGVSVESYPNVLSRTGIILNVKYEL